MTRVVAVIPARGGSKQVPRKNLRRVGGVPLIARAIASALVVTAIDRVIVSTDDAEIADVAVGAGAEPLDRPADLSGDTASSESALLHALEHVPDVDVLVFLQATSPFIDTGALARAVELVTSDRFDSVFSAVATYGFLWRTSPDDTVLGVNHDPAHRPRRQDREPDWLETGAFYVMRATGFVAARHRFFGRIGTVEVPETTSIEIDSMEQLQLADAIASTRELDPVASGRSQGSAS